MDDDLPIVPDSPAGIAEIVVPLMRADRCEQRDCPARAMVRVRKGLLFLDFCGHHYAKHELALVSGGWHINHDIRTESTTPRESSADR